MRKLPLPADEPVEVHQTCNSRVADVGLAARLKAIEPMVAAAGNAFGIAAAAATLHEFPRSNAVPSMTKTEMSSIYSSRMVPKRSPGRPIYERLLAAPPHARCPLCAQRTVSTLDHHLPQKYYLLLVTVPANLVPACADCNKIKSTSVPTSHGTQTLHPYYDDIGDATWVQATVIEASPAALVFDVSPPAGSAPEMVARVRHHFKTFKLAELYGSHAASELENIRFAMGRLFATGGHRSVQVDLADRAASCHMICKNAWQTAMFAALAANDWFCSGGFQG